VRSEKLKSQRLEVELSKSKAKSVVEFQQKHLLTLIYLDGSFNRTRTIKIRLNKHTTEGINHKSLHCQILAMNEQDDCDGLSSL